MFVVFVFLLASTGDIGDCKGEGGNGDVFVLLLLLLLSLLNKFE